MKNSKHSSRKENTSSEPNIYMMGLEESMEKMSKGGLEPEVCEVPVPVLSNKASCGIPTDIGDPVADDFYLLPKSVVGLNPLVDIHARGDSMIGAGIEDGDVLRLEVGATAHDGDIVLAELDGEFTAKVFFTDDEGQRWLVPMNTDYKPLRLTSGMVVRISGVVRFIVKSLPRFSHRELREQIRRCMEGRSADLFELLENAAAAGSQLFWAASAWAVAYGVARDCCGFKATVKEFERRASQLNLPASFEFKCSPGTVQRTISNHPYMRLHTDRWKDKGASPRELVLLGFLRNQLQV